MALKIWKNGRLKVEQKNFCLKINPIQLIIIPTKPKLNGKGIMKLHDEDLINYLSIL